MQLEGHQIFNYGGGVATTRSRRVRIEMMREKDAGHGASREKVARDNASAPARACPHIMDMHVANRTTRDASRRREAVE